MQGFNTTNLEKVNLHNAEIHKSNLTNASLNGANLLEAQLHNNNLEKTKLNKLTKSHAISLGNTGNIISDELKMVNGIITTEVKAKEIEKNLKPIDPNNLTSPLLVIKTSEPKELYIPYLVITLVSKNGTYTDYIIAGIDINNESVYNKAKDMFIIDLNILNEQNNNEQYEISEVRVFTEASDLPKNVKIYGSPNKDKTLNIPRKTEFDVIYVKGHGLPVKSNKHKNMLIKLSNDKVKYV
jgi:hypothetical protein